MYIPKDNLHNHQRKVGWISEKVRNQLHRLGPDYPESKQCNLTPADALVQAESRHQRRVPEERKVGDARPVDHEVAPCVAPEKLGAPEHDGVASECRAGPAEELAAELGPLAEGRLDVGFVGFLPFDEPVLGDGVAGEEVVVVGTEALSVAEEAKEELFLAKVLHQLGVFEETRSVSGCSSGDDKGATIHGVGGSHFPVVALEIVAGEKVDD